jgi:hypothetical protein
MDYKLTPDFILKTIGEIEGKENIDRKRRAWISSQVREGAVYDYVQARLKQMYPKSWPMYSVSEYSLLAKIVRKKAMAYKQAPVRRVEDEAAQEAYEQVAKDMKLNKAMKSFDSVYNEHKYAMMAILMETVDSAPKWRTFALAPYEYDCIFDGAGEVKVVILSYPPATVTRLSDGIDQAIAEPNSGDMRSRSYEFWTGEEYIRASVEGPMGRPNPGKLSIEPMGANGANPYGVLPFVYAPYTYDVDYPVRSPLPSQTVELNALMSVYLTSANMQVGVFCLKYPAGQEVKPVSGSMYTVLQLPQSTNPDDPSTDAEFISPTPNLPGHREAITTYAGMILDEAGIGSQGLTGDMARFTSGLDRLISMADVQEIIEDNQETYREVEQDIFRIVSQQLLAINNSVLVGQQLGVTYIKPKVMVSDSEILDNMAKMKALGIFSDYEILQVFDPNLSEDEAKLKLSMIMQERGRMVDAMEGEDVGDEPEPGDVDADD